MTDTPAADPLPPPLPRTDFTQAFLAFFIVFGALGLIVLVIFHPPPAEYATPIFTLIASVNTLAGVVGGYFFVSSRGSAKKDDSRDANMTTMVNKLSEKNTETGSGGNMMAAAREAAAEVAPEAAKEAAPQAAKEAAPPAAEKAAPPVVEVVAPPLIEKAVEKAFAKQDLKTQESEK